MTYLVDTCVSSDFARGLRLFLNSLILAFAGFAQAQDFPSKPIHIVVPFAAGGGVDVLARAIGQRLSEQISQPVIVDNKPGGNANIGPDFVAKAPGDGNRADLPFNVQRDLAPVAYVGYAPLVLVAPDSFGAKTLADVIRLAKAEPGKLNYASAGSEKWAGVIRKANIQPE